MLTADMLVDLVRRFLLRDGETITWTKQFTDGPAVDIETSTRALSVKVAADRLRIGRAGWVDAVVVADQDVILVPRDGAPVHLNDRATAAELGPRLHRGDLDPVAFAEIVVLGQWPGGWQTVVVVDPPQWRGRYPAQAPLPPVEAPRTWRDGEELQLSFFASREYAEAVGGRAVLDVTAWSVRVPAGAPATWELRPVATAVPLMPPWPDATERAQTASADDWHEAYGRVYAALPGDAHVPCPNCGQDALHVAFTGPTGGRVGFASFWCDNCRYGLHLSRATAPQGVELIPIELSADEHAKLVPDYTLVTDA